MRVIRKNQAFRLFIENQNLGYLRRSIYTECIEMSTYVNKVVSLMKSYMHLYLPILLVSILHSLLVIYTINVFD